MRLFFVPFLIIPSRRGLTPREGASAGISSEGIYTWRARMSDAKQRAAAALRTPTKARAEMRPLATADRIALASSKKGMRLWCWFLHRAAHLHRYVLVVGHRLMHCYTHAFNCHATAMLSVLAPVLTMPRAQRRAQTRRET